MKLRIEKKILKANEDTDVPDFAFDFTFTGIGPDQAEIIYLVPSDKEDIVKAQASEIAAHLMGRYR